ncbi:MaoC/PaaZ C-terminal domain-containing protein [Sphingomonas naphthae]|uniref:MaoC/PaaZ C-terminal domain-containing protein n=1 Tax=Sphingomonas naphthae TaxID=1813468 RepID=A0ABY7TG23_9SPHN|nr:MaoC/PaaZ C-terminal domain-containing protein [Sphingomonas naphthae]WCT72181.1 MaoC/PaaZ C-terminal domain-containing protein [Sphingomonas naphthae]
MKLADLLETKVRGWQRQWDERDTLLYALSLGFGMDPVDPVDHRFVYEGVGLHTVPTMAVVLASTGILQKTGLSLPQVLHAGQRLAVHRPLPAQGALLADASVMSIADRGPTKGAFVELRTEARLAIDDAPLFTFDMIVLAREIGGIGSAGCPFNAAHGDPVRPADRTVTLDTRPDAALLYRLNGDRNPLHADPEVARRVGFERPILHGLCTYGMVCRALVRAGVAPESLMSLDARFSAPVYPGDRLSFDLWDEGSDIRFNCRVADRDVVVLRDGLCRRR